MQVPPNVGVLLIEFSICCQSSTSHDMVMIMLLHVQQRVVKLVPNTFSIEYENFTLLVARLVHESDLFSFPFP